MDSPQLPLLLHLADNCLVLGQRNAEWCGHAPVLEEDIALANHSLDLIGQSRLLYQYAAELIGKSETEDSLAYFRDAPAFRNFTLLELPHHGPLAPSGSSQRDFATTLVRNFLYSAWALDTWSSLAQCSDAQLAAIAAKAVKETLYHWQYAQDWVIRMGDGTAESQQRAQAALEHLMPYSQEFWMPLAHAAAAQSVGVSLSHADVQAEWLTLIDAVLFQAYLKRPPDGGFVPSGNHGIHSEHLTYLLGEMQSLARAHPKGVW
jgi:ring-1,2-phenylacetyl-CoA epoxidase subunit PaaC